MCCQAMWVDMYVVLSLYVCLTLSLSHAHTHTLSLSFSVTRTHTLSLSLSLSVCLFVYLSACACIYAWMHDMHVCLTVCMHAFSIIRTSMYVCFVSLLTHVFLPMPRHMNKSRNARLHAVPVACVHSEHLFRISVFINHTLGMNSRVETCLDIKIISPRNR